MRVSLSQISILSYVLPAFISVYATSAYGYDMSESGKTAIFASVVFSILGYATSRISGTSNLELNQRQKSKTDFTISYFLMTIGIFSIILNFGINMSIPLLMGGAKRIDLQHSLLWSVYVLCSLGVFIYSRASMTSKETFLGKALVALYLLTALLTAWKGTLLFNLILFFAPRLRNKTIPLLKAAKYSFIMSSVLILMNFMRSDAPLSHVLAQPAFYLLWGFVNFDREATQTSSDCIHSIPITGCQFAVDNELLILPTWNVFTALSPLYIDGGVLLVSLSFFVFSLSLGLAEKSRRTLLNDYIYFMFLYFFLLAHNGYSFYSTTFVASLVILGIIKFLKVVSRDVSHNQKQPQALKAS